MACVWRSSRAGELRAVWVPDPADEAIRDLVRAREDAVNARTQARQQLKAFCCAMSVRYPQRTSWTKTFYRWLATLNFGSAGAQIAFTEYWQAVSAADERVARLTEALVRRSKAGASSRWYKPCRRCAGSIRSVPSAWWPRSAILVASPIRGS